MTLSRSFALLVLALSASSQLAAQRTWIVDQAGGPGHHFTSLQPAIAAASAGDTILVRAGAYQETMLDVDKGLSIVGVGSVALELGAFLQPLPGMHVHDLRGGETFAIRGIDLGGSFAIPHILAERCAGLVTVQDATGPVSSLGVPAPMSLRFEDCNQVHVDDVFVRDGGTLQFVGSRGAVTRSALEGYLGGALQVTDSAVTFDGCTITSGFGPFTISEPVRATGGTLRLSRTSVTVNSPTSVTSAIGATPATTIVLDPTATLTPAAGQPPISGEPTVVQAELTTLRVVAGQGALDLELQSRVGAIFVTLLSFPTPALPTPFGDLWVDPAGHLVLHSGVLVQRADRTQLTTAVLPPGLTAVVQAIVLDGSLELSNGTAVVFP